jgi:hypothetical protein
MDTPTLIKEIYRKVNGELDETVTPESIDGQTILSIINETVDDYYNAVDASGERIIWNRNIDPEYIIGSASNTQTSYDIDWNEVAALPDGFDFPIRIGGVRYDLVPLDELYGGMHTNSKVCAFTANGLTFANPPEDKGDISIPAMLLGRHITGNEKDVEATTGVHPVLWLLRASAAEYVRTDMVRGGQYPNLLSAANSTYQRMLSDNEARTSMPTYSEMPTRTVTYDGSIW